VQVRALFVFPRPKADYRTGRCAEGLKDTAPWWHTGTPDLDKLQRALGDALKGPVLRDDAQIAAWNVSKRYGTEPRAEVAIDRLTERGEG